MLHTQGGLSLYNLRSCPVLQHWGPLSQRTLFRADSSYMTHGFIFVSVDCLLSAVVLGDEQSARGNVTKLCWPVRAST